MNRREIGEALDRLEADVRDHVRDLTEQYRRFGVPMLLKQAVDTPHRARMQVTAWIVEYNSRNGAGSAQTFLTECLTAAGSTKTVASIDAALAALENGAQTLVTNVGSGWTWDQVASAIEASINPAPSESFSYADLPIPAGYLTVWGEPY